MLLMAQNYVAHAIWIVIITLSTLTAVSYLIYFERHFRSTATHLVAAATVTPNSVSRVRRIRRRLRRVVRQTSARARALAVVTAVFIVCWYPLHALTVIDPDFRHPFKVF